MNRTKTFGALAACLTSSIVLAQSTVVIPAGLATVEGNTSNAFPWGRGASGLLHQGLYDASNFTSQAITFPILIQELRWRPNTNVSLVASSYTVGCSVSLSTAPAGSGVAPSNTLANNRGADYALCFTGPVSWNAQTGVPGPQPFHIAIPLQSTFLYDPTAGDLLIECDLPPQAFTGSGPQLDVQSTGSLSSRVYVSTGYPGTGTGSVSTNHGVVVEVVYVPASGLYAGFTSDVQTGASPLTVNFTDTTFTSDPGGVLTWAWDFENDGIVDSTVQNPTHVYPVCGDFDVSLTVTDASNPASTLVRTAYIRPDYAPITPSFTFAPIAPGVYQFTDTSSPTPTGWAWDLDGDGVTDSTAQNPVWAYSAVCSGVPVTLSVTNLCHGPWSVTQTIVLSPNSFVTTLSPNNGLSSNGAGNLFDIDVTDPKGVNICALTLTPYSTSIGTQITCDVYVTDAPGGFASNYNNAAVWRHVATGTGADAGTSGAPVLFALSNGIFLPFGQYAMAVSTTQGLRYMSLSGLTTYPGPHFTITSGRSASPLFSSGINNRGVCAELHYSALNAGDQAGFGYFGAGCAGSMGISSLSNDVPPALGNTMTVTADNLPSSTALAITGFSKTAWAGGPLPYDVSALGAPGCFLRVSDDALLFVAGSGNTASWQLTVPNDPSYIGMNLYYQALVFDPGFNPAGAVGSDAHGLMIGL